MNPIENDYEPRVVYAAKEIQQDHDHRMGLVHHSRKRDWDSLYDGLKMEYLNVAAVVDEMWAANPGMYQSQNTLSEVVDYYMTRYAFAEQDRQRVADNAAHYVRAYEKGLKKWEQDRGI